MNKILSILPTQSLVYCLICGAGIIAFIFLIIIPSHKTSTELDQDIKDINNRIEEQRILRPVFDSLLKRAKKEDSTDLSLTQTQAFKPTSGDINAITDLLREIARSHDFVMKDISTDVAAMMKNTGPMQMRVNITGDFMKFRDFLIDLSAVSVLEEIEEIQIRAVEGAREFDLKIRMAPK